MPSKNDWDSSKYDDPENTAELHLQQFSSTTICATDSSYDVEGNI